MVDQLIQNSFHVKDGVIYVLCGPVPVQAIPATIFLVETSGFRVPLQVRRRIGDIKNDSLTPDKNSPRPGLELTAAPLAGLVIALKEPLTLLAFPGPAPFIPKAARWWLNDDFGAGVDSYRLSG